MKIIYEYNMYNNVDESSKYNRAVTNVSAMQNVDKINLIVHE